MEEQLAPFPAVRAWKERVPERVGRRQYTQVGSLTSNDLDALD